MISIDPTILALAATGLPTAPRLPRHGWDQRLDEIFRNGLAGFLARAYAAGVIELNESSAELLKLRLESEAIRAVQLEGELIRLAPLLADLPAAVIKGAVLAHGAYPDPQLRPFTDIDLIVADESHGDAVAALEGFGYVRTRPEPTPGYDARVGKALTLSHPGGVVVDLHRTLVAGVQGVSIHIEELLETRGSIELGGVAIPAPTWEAHLIEAALHAVVGDGLGRALSIRDVAQLALLADLDGRRAAALAARWKVNGTVAGGLRAAADGLGFELPSSLRGLAEQSAPLDLAPTAESRSARIRLDELRHGPVRRRITVLRAMLTPSRAFLRWNEGEGSVPRLYGRRWRTLYRRTTEARGDPTPAARTRPVTPPGGAFTRRRSAEPDDGWTGSPSRALARARPPAVALARLLPNAPVTRPRAGLLAVGAGGAASSARSAVPARQERWTAHRPRHLPAGATKGDDTHDGNDVGDREDAGEGGPPIVPPVAVPGAGAAAERSRGIPVAVAPSGVRFCIGGLALLVVTAIATRIGISALGVALIPAAAVLFAVAAERRITRLRPEEHWVGQWLVIGVIAKVAASYLRYLTLVVSYEGVGDATLYDQVGRELALAWAGKGPDPTLIGIKETNFVKWFTGLVYYAFGANQIAGYFVFGLLALVGSYLWYRATVDAVPMMDKRVYLFLVLFAPSIAFWPSSIGKEALMQLGIGAMALGTSYLMRQDLLKGLAFGLAGGWWLYTVRPHLLALVTIATGLAYLAGRVKPRDAAHGNVLIRSLGLLVIALLVGFAIGQGTQFLGIKDLSVSSVETTLDNQSKGTAKGGSSFDNGGDYLSPVNLPRGAVTVLLRPFPWETGTPFQLLASLESAVVIVFILFRLGSLKNALLRARTSPFLLYCWILTILYSATFAAFSNFGLLVRQRSLVLPAFYVLLSVSAAPLARSSPSDRPVIAEPSDHDPTLGARAMPGPSG